MPDFGLTKAAKAALKAAKVTRGAEAVAEATKATQAVSVGPVLPAAPKPASQPPPALATSRAMGERNLTDAEAARQSSLKLGSYDLEASHQTNFDTITTTDELKAVIADASERNKGKINVSRRGVIADEQLRLLAADLDVDAEVIRPVLEREAGGVLNPEQILAARQVLNASANEVFNLGKLIASGQANDLDRLRFRRQVLFHDDFQVQFMGARAETGRALHTFKIPVGLELDPDKLKRMRMMVDGMHGNDTDQLAAMIAQMESPAQVSKFVKQYGRSKVQGVLQENFINSILSGPTTHLVNVSGNALFQMMNVAEHGIAAQVGKMLSGAEHVQVGEATAMLYGQLTGWRDAMRYAWLAFKNGESLDDTVKYEGHTRRAISSQNLFPQGAPPSVAAAVDLIGATVRIPTERVMVPADEFFKTMAYRADLARQAYLEVNRRVAGGAKLSEQEIAEITRKIMENPTAAQVKKADDFARYTTFQHELGVSGQAAQRWVASTKVGFVIAPFIRTPVNIFKAGLLERSPLAIFSSDFRSAIAKGGPERDLAVARVSMGSLTVAAVAAAAMDGRVTGGGPQDSGARRLLEATGWQPYSIVFTNPLTGEKTYQSYARAEPLAFVIGATADLVEMRAYMNADDPLASDEENMNRAIAATIAAVANNTMSKTFLSGVADFSAMLEDPARYSQGWISRTSQAFLPYSAFRRSLAKIQDPLIREAWSYTDKLKASAGLPGYSEGLPPKRDIFGAPIEWRGGSVLGVVSPFPDTVESSDTVAHEIAAVMQETGTVPVTMPARKIDGMRLTTQEYDELVRYARAEPNLNGSETFRDALEGLFQSSTYLIATPDMKAVLIKQVRESADEVGRQMLVERNPDFAARLELHRLKKSELMQGLPQ